MLMADVAGVKSSGTVHIAGAFDDGPAIREYCEFAALSLKLQHELVEAHFTQGFKLGCHVIEI